MKMTLIIFLSSFACFNLNANVGTAGFKNFPNYYFVETGTFSGDGILKALEANCFNEIHSIEVDEGLLNACMPKFRKNQNVKIVQGNSKDMLWDVIKDMDKPITFWLDAHIYPPIFDGSDGRKNAPLMEELEQIKRHPIKNHTILIDDMSCCGTLAFDYVTREDLIKEIKSINPNYTVTFIVGGNDDEVEGNILFAKVY